MQKVKSVFDEMPENWPSNVVAREKVGEFTGGLIHPRTMANLDCQGKGPKGRFRVGPKIAYPLHELVEWLNNRIVIVEEDDLPIELKGQASINSIKKGNRRINNENSY